MGSASSSLKSMSAGKRSTPLAGRLVREELKSSASPSPSKESSSGSKVSKEKDSKKPKRASKEQLERWTSSINALFADEDGIMELREYLRKFSSEDEKYIDFYQECQQFKDEMNRLEKKANEIFETFLDVGGERQLGIKGEEVEIKLEMLNEESPKNLFDVTQQKAKEHLDKILYPRFCDYLRQEKYKELIQ